MAYLRWSSPLPLTKPCPECKRPVTFMPAEVEAEEEADARYYAWMQCHDYQMRWAEGPWWCRWLSNIASYKQRSIGGRNWRTRLYFFAKRYDRGRCKTCTSKWYVFNNCNGMLSVWGGGHTADIEYEEIERIVAEKDYDAIPGYKEIGGQGVLESVLALAVEEWRDD